MKALIIYKSKTGFTKWYAEFIAKEMDGNLMDLKEVTTEIMSGYDVVVYGGGLYAGMINGYKKAKEMFEKSSANRFILFATGGTPNESTKEIEEVWKNNLSAEEGFAQAIKSSYDIKAKEYAEPLIKYLLEG